MAEELKNPVENGEKLVRNGNGQFVKGHPPLPNAGHPLGKPNFGTDFDDVVEEIAKANNITTSEARKVLLKKAYAEARNGNFPYSKDIFDRYYGKPQERVDLTSGGERLSLDKIAVSIEEISKKTYSAEDELNKI